MEVYPEDLGACSYQQVLRHRAQRYGLLRAVQEEPNQEAEELSPRLSRWIEKSGVDELQAKYARPAFDLCRLWQKVAVRVTIALFAVAGTIAGFMWLQMHPLRAELIAVGSVVVLVCGLLYGNMRLPRLLFSRVHNKLSPRDIGRLLKVSEDPLKRMYYDLAFAAMQLPQQMDNILQENIRKSLLALGNAIDDVGPEEHQLSLNGFEDKRLGDKKYKALDYSDTTTYVGLGLSRKLLRGNSQVAHHQFRSSVYPPSGLSVKPDALKRQAEQLLVEATAENDPVVAASLKRRSASLVHQANTIVQIDTLQRRNKALRGEIEQQMNSLSTRLNASHLMRGQAAQGLADVFDQITHLASEASHVAAAQEELVSALSSQ